MAFDWTTLIVPGITALTGMGGMAGIWAVHAERVKARAAIKAAEARASAEAPANMLQAMAAFQKSLNDTGDSLTAGLRKDIAQLRESLRTAESRIDSLELENAQCRAENEEIRGELRNVKQWGESLSVKLREAGIPIPARELPGSWVMIEHGVTTTMKAG